MNESISRVREAGCFAGVFLIVHLIIGALFDQGVSIHAPEGTFRWSPDLNQLLHSVIAVAVATPIYLVLMSMYTKRKAKKSRSSDREQ